MTGARQMRIGAFFLAFTRYVAQQAQVSAIALILRFDNQFLPDSASCSR